MLMLLPHQNSTPRRSISFITEHLLGGQRFLLRRLNPILIWLLHIVNPEDKQNHSTAQPSSLNSEPGFGTRQLGSYQIHYK